MAASITCPVTPEEARRRGLLHRLGLATIVQCPACSQSFTGINDEPFEAMVEHYENEKAGVTDPAPLPTCPACGGVVDVGYPRLDLDLCESCSVAFDDGALDLSDLLEDS